MTTTADQIAAAFAAGKDAIRSEIEAAREDIERSIAEAKPGTGECQTDPAPGPAMTPAETEHPAPAAEQPGDSGSLGGAAADESADLPGVSTGPTRVHVEWEFDDSEPPPRKRRLHVGCGGGVTRINGRPKCHRCGAVDDNAGWVRRLLMWNWHWLALDGYPGWDVVGDGYDRRPPAVELTHIFGEGKQSIDIAREYDDSPGGLFYQRDFTSDGVPFVRDKETYRSMFWFERTADRDAFLKRYGGVAR